MLRHAKAEHRFDFAAFQVFTQLLYRRNPEFLVDTQYTLGIESRIIGEARDLGRRLAAQRLQFPELSGQDDFPDCARNRFSDSGKLRQIGIFPDQFVETIRKRTDLCRGAVVRLDLVWIFFLCREQLRQAGKPIRYLRVAER